MRERERERVVTVLTKYRDFKKKITLVSGVDFFVWYAKQKLGITSNSPVFHLLLPPFQSVSA